MAVEFGNSEIPAKHKEVPCRSAFLLIVRICSLLLFFVGVYLFIITSN